MRDEFQFPLYLIHLSHLHADTDHEDVGVKINMFSFDMIDVFICRHKAQLMEKNTGAKISKVCQSHSMSLHQGMNTWI